MIKIIEARQLPRWKRLPLDERTPGFAAVRDTIPVTYVYLKHRVHADYVVPGNAVCGESWCRELWRLERDALARRGETLERRLVFKYHDGFLRYVGYDSRYKIRMQWFGFMPNTLKNGDKVIVLL